MNGVPVSIRLAIVSVMIGMVVSVACIVKTTAMTMTLFFFLGLPCFLLAILLYLWTVIRDLRRHGVV